jgi:hypothetical protein
MFRLPRLKLYRKFLILAILSGSLFVTSSLNNAAATIPYCCPLWHACDDEIYGCYVNCNWLINNPPRYQQCTAACDDANFQCYIDAEPCNHECEY